MCRILRVSGNSLLPLLQNGDFVLISKIPISLKKIDVGDIIAFNQIPYGVMIKQVQEIWEEGRYYFVTGTNNDSVDSRSFGPVPREAVIGKVLWKSR
jgi:phage repressor protein C with HTH and peptisase S24 domain